MSAKRTRLQRVGAPRRSSSGSAAQPSTAPASSTAPAAAPAPARAPAESVMAGLVDEQDPEQIWALRPCHHQPLSTEFELTHSRPMPLPFAMNLVMGDKTYFCLYSGHGKIWQRCEFLHEVAQH